MNHRRVVVDFETTGFHPSAGARVIEIGAVAIEGGKVTDEFQTLVHSVSAIPYAAQRVHGISVEMLQGAPLPEVAWSRFSDFRQASPLIDHNAQFEKAFLHHEFSRLGVSFANEIHCSLALCRNRLRSITDHKLETVARHLLGGVPAHYNLHRALDDARLTAQVWLELTG